MMIYKLFPIYEYEWSLFGHFRIFTRARAHMVRNKFKKNIPQVSNLYLNFNLCRTVMQVSQINNPGFLVLNDQFFIPVKVMVQKIRNSVDFIHIIVAVPQNS